VRGFRVWLYQKNHFNGHSRGNPRRSHSNGSRTGQRPPAEPANEVQAGQLLHSVQVLSGSNYADARYFEARANNYLKASIIA
jgi:hypothetical protein